MFSLEKFGRRSFLTAAVVAISCGVTYYADEKRNEAKVADLENQVDSLSKKMLLARVTQRVSEQMEDIANQQSLISDKERERAEKQSEIADRERRNAERERGLAILAQNEALASAQEAKISQAHAEAESKRATENMLIAREAKAHADTLYHLSLANSLAQSSITQFNNKNDDLARLLALASWHYCNEYGGDPTIQQNIFKSLLNTSNSNHENIRASDGSTLKINGNIRKIHILDNGAITGITDYGDVFIVNNNLAIYDNIDNCNFRDFYSYGSPRSLALCEDGRIIEYDLSNITQETTKEHIDYRTRLKLPFGFWKRLIGINHGETLVAMSDNMVVWIDGETMTIKDQATTETKTTCLGKQGQGIHVFCENGIHYYSSVAGQLQSLNMENIGKGIRITSYIFSKEKGMHFLGLSNGKIFAYDINGNKINELLGHEGPITDLHTWNDILGSTSYDKTIRLWNIHNVSAIVTPVVVSYGKWIHTFDVNLKNNTVWLGLEDGDIPYFSCDLMKNAARARQNLTREFTDREWEYYVGKGIERINFMK